MFVSGTGGILAVFSVQSVLQKSGPSDGCFVHRWLGSWSNYQLFCRWSPTTHTPALHRYRVCLGARSLLGIQIAGVISAVVGGENVLRPFAARAVPHADARCSCKRTWLPPLFRRFPADSRRESRPIAVRRNSRNALVVFQHQAVMTR